jgi:histidinol-phosphate/aromatic aminotransferase/cobyric acid decarboxylase-like protein
MIVRPPWSKALHLAHHRPRLAWRIGTERAVAFLRRVEGLWQVHLNEHAELAAARRLDEHAEHAAAHLAYLRRTHRAS